MSFLDPAIAVTLIDVAEDESDETAAIDSTEEAEQVVERGRRAGPRAGPERRLRGSPAARPGREIVRAAIEGKFDAIFMSLRGVYRRGDTTAFASNTRYVLENAPCRVILGFAPKSIQHPGGVHLPKMPSSHEEAGRAFREVAMRSCGKNPGINTGTRGSS